MGSSEGAEGSVPGAAPSPRGGAESRRAARTRRELTEAAAAILDEEGLAGATVKAITERAEVAHGTFYNYFDSTDAIVQAALQNAALTIAQATEDDGDLDADNHVLSFAHWIVTTFQRFAALPGLEWMLERPTQFATVLAEALSRYAVRDIAVLEARGLDVARAAGDVPLFCWLMVGALHEVHEGRRGADAAALTVAEIILHVMNLTPEQIDEIFIRLPSVARS